MKRKSIFKTLHILFACLWLGAATSVVLLQCAQGWSESSQELAVLNHNFAILDIALIIPGATGSLLTGFWICKTTTWGFTRYRWVLVKWAGTLCAILVGTALLGPWQLRMVRLSSLMADGLGGGAAYDLVRILFTLAGALQVILLVLIVAISVRKPWGKRLSRQNEAGKEGQRTFSTS